MVSASMCATSRVCVGTAALGRPFRPRRLVHRHGSVDQSGPPINAAKQRLRVFEALLAQPMGDIGGADAVMANDDNVVVGIEFAVGAGRDFRHWQGHAASDVRKLKFPRLAHIEEAEGKFLVELGLELFRGNLEFHDGMVTLSATLQVWV